MANTIPDITVSGEWVDVYTVTGITLNADITICNKGGYRILIQEASSKPATADNSGKLVSSYLSGTNNAVILNNTSKVWLKATKGSCDVNVQEV